MTIYIDSLFLVNFFMDTAILFAVSVLRRRRGVVLRIFAAAIFSAVYGTIAFFPNLTFLYGAIFKVIISAVTVLIAYGIRGIRDFLYSWASFWFVSGACAGIVLAESFFTDFGKIMQISLSNCIMYANINPIIMLIACSILYVLIEMHRRMSIRSFSRERILLDIRVIYMGNSYKLTALIDTGCELTEPLSGSPVLVAEKDIFKGIETSGVKIFARTASGSGELSLIFPERIESFNHRYSIRDKTAIALTDTRFSYDGLYNAVLNPDATEDNIGETRIIQTKYKLTELN